MRCGARYKMHYEDQTLEECNVADARHKEIV